MEQRVLIAFEQLRQPDLAYLSAVVQLLEHVVRSDHAA